ncbi:MAG: 6-pyruvoyl-tetrahydropterin synthase-related protein, partial [Candidatus Binatia bacterium]
IGYIPAWLTWNYSGYEGKRTWPLFEKINDHVRGTINDPRVVFEHSEMHNRFGSSRAFENLPLFAGRSTLEGVFHQASINSPYVFYLQSEVSERGSGPFPQYTYTRLNPDLALPHLRMYNVDTVIAVTDKARAAYDSHPDFERTMLSGSYAVYSVRGGNTGYVSVPPNEPVLYEGPDWKLAFYRWFRRPELSDIPLVPASLLDPKRRREFSLRTDSISRIPREAVDQACSARSTLEQYRIAFDTDCPGLPHIVKVSYFPRWKTTDGSPLFPVSPGFMLVYPRGEHLELVYGRNPLDWISIGLSVIGLLWLFSCVVSRRLLDQSESSLIRLLDPVLVVFERRRLLISVLVVASMATAGVAARRNLTRPLAAFAQAQDAYKRRDFETAVRKLEAWVARDKDTFKQATALYQLGVSHSELGHHTAAVQVHERLRFEFPNVDYGAGTLYHLARNYKSLGLVERANHYRALLEKNHSETNWAKRLDREWRGESAGK